MDNISPRIKNKNEIKNKQKSKITVTKMADTKKTIGVRGTVMTGTVVSAASHLSATVKIDRQIYISKYKRYLLKTSKIRVHNPANIDAKVGDIVEFMGCRPISKTKSSIITKIVTKAVDAKNGAQ